MKYVLDANTMIELIRKNHMVVAKYRERYQTDDISSTPVAYYETLRGLLYLGAVRKTKDFREFYHSMNPLPVSENDVAEKAAELYAVRKHKGLAVGDNDLFIAAWCIVANATLVTNDIKHFADIDGLTVENWKNSTAS
jgi:predicted nucleic acid-binding protein